WWVQGFAEEEDISFKKIVADYQKASGNTIECTITPYAPLRQKVVAAIQTGGVPDMFVNNPGGMIAPSAWGAKPGAVSDWVESANPPYAPLRQKVAAAIQTGVVPDMFVNNPGEIIALYAWDDKLVDVSDVVETQKSQYSETALHTAYCYNRVTKKRSFYGAPF